MVIDVIARLIYICFPNVLQSETEIELGSLLRQDFQGLHNELLLRLGEHYQQVRKRSPTNSTFFSLYSSTYISVTCF